MMKGIEIIFAGVSPTRLPESCYIGRVPCVNESIVIHGALWRVADVLHYSKTAEDALGAVATITVLPSMEKLR